MYVCMHVFVCVCVYVYMYVCLHMCVCLCMYMYAFAYMYACIYDVCTMMVWMRYVHMYVFFRLAVVS